MRHLCTIGIAAAALTLIGGCAAGSLEGAAKCETSGDCAPQKICINQKCVVPTNPGSDTQYPKLDVVDPVDSGTRPDSAPPTDTPSGSDTRPPDEDSSIPPNDSTVPADSRPIDTAAPPKMDTGPKGCGGQCGLGEKCENGTCVSKCPQGCRSDQQCADLGNGPTCFDKCNELFSAKNCSQHGELCRDLTPNSMKSTLVCRPSQCSTHAECPRGTCFQRVNGHGVCEQNGPQKAGQQCDLSAQNMRCEAGAFCVPNNPQSAVGTCRRLCDPWSGASSCNSNERCSLFKRTSGGQLFALALRQGYCNPSVDPTGRANLDSCNGAQYMCNHGVRCLGTQSPLCFKWCRPGEGDCTGTIPPSYSASGVCDNYVVPGERRIGRCVPACSGSRYCSSNDRACIQSICRQTCSQATVVQDCCGGRQPCDWKCKGGYCE